MNPVQKSRFWMAGFLALIILYLVSGCGSSSRPVSYYTLSSLNPEGVKPILSLAGQNLSVGLGPIILPEYLEGSKIVTRKSLNLLSINDSHRWGGSLKGDITRTLSANLSYLTGITHIISYPWRSNQAPDYQVSIEFLSFDAIPGDSIDLVAVWTLSSKKDSTDEVTRVSTIKKQITSMEMESVVAEESRAIEQLSLEIAKAIAKK